LTLIVASKVQPDLVALASLSDMRIIFGELLSIRDSTLTLCTEYNANEAELVDLKYPVKIVRNERIEELTIRGNSYVYCLYPSFLY